MGGVRGGEVVRIHLFAEGVNRGVDEESGSGGAGYAPYYVGRRVVVPSADFGDDARAVGWGGQVGGYVVESLRSGATWCFCL